VILFVPVLTMMLGRGGTISIDSFSSVPRTVSRVTTRIARHKFNLIIINQSLLFYYKCSSILMGNHKNKSKSHVGLNLVDLELSAAMSLLCDTFQKLFSFDLSVNSKLTFHLFSF